MYIGGRQTSPTHCAKSIPHTLFIPSGCSAIISTGRSAGARPYGLRLLAGGSRTVVVAFIYSHLRLSGSRVRICTVIASLVHQKSAVVASAVPSMANIDIAPATALAELALVGIATHESGLLLLPERRLLLLRYPLLHAQV